MSKFHVFTSSIILASTSASLVYPQDLPQINLFHASHENSLENIPHLNGGMSYDDVLRLINLIETGELEEKCTPQQLDEIRHFMAFLAQKGSLPDSSEESFSLDGDIQDLLGERYKHEDVMSLVMPGELRYSITPAISYDKADRVLCKSWFSKQWSHLHHFVEKHKKAILIGTAVVIATAAIITGVVLAAPLITGFGTASAAGTAGVAVASDSAPSISSEPIQTVSTIAAESSSGIQNLHEGSLLQTQIEHQISSFKETIVQNQFFQPINPVESQLTLSWEDNARVLGSTFAHDSFNFFQHQIPQDSKLAQEVHEIHVEYASMLNAQPSIGHPQIDYKFSTDFSHLFANPQHPLQFQGISHLALGEKALENGYYNEAVYDFEKAIQVNPSTPLSYLEMGAAHFNLGEYDRSIADYRQYTLQVAMDPMMYQLSVCEFSYGFAKGLPKGVYESGEGVLLFLADFVSHPIHTSKQMVDAFGALARLVGTDEWATIGQMLAPEVYELVTQWDYIPSDKRGELAGYALGKHGADILAPGALFKIAQKSAKSAHELISVCKNIQIAQNTLVLETAAGIGSGVKLAEVIETGQRTVNLAEELGFSTKEMARLMQSGDLDSTISKTLEQFSPSLKESHELYKKAQSFLEQYTGYMSESQARDLIHQTGIKTFPRPAGIPDNFRVNISSKGAGMVYTHPEHNHTKIRVMPGKPHSSFPAQQKPYVTYRKEGKALDKSGNVVNSTSSEAHIPLEEFIFRG